MADDIFSALGLSDGGYEDAYRNVSESKPSDYSSFDTSLPAPADVAVFDQEATQPEPTATTRRARRSRASLELEQQAIPEVSDEVNVPFGDIARGWARAVASPLQTLYSEGQPDRLSTWDRLMLGVGQAGGSLQSQLGGLRTFLGNDEEGRKASEAGRETQREYANLGDANGPDVFGDVAQDITGQAVASAAPSVAAGMVGGVPGMVMTAAAQTIGSVMDEAVPAYEDQGYSREDSIKMARPVAALTGAITAGLTMLMPGGSEALVNRLVKGSLPAGTARQFVFEIAKEALKEFPEEFADQMSQDIAARFTYDPTRSWKDIVADAFQAGSMGVGTGLGVGAVGAVLGRTGGHEPATTRATSAAPEPVSNQPQNIPENISTPAPEPVAQGEVETQPATSAAPTVDRRLQIGQRILELNGVDPESAAAIAERFVAERGQEFPTISENFRDALIGTVDQIGYKRASDEGRIFRLDQGDYEAAGLTPEQAARAVQDAEKQNAAILEQVNAANQQAVQQYAAPTTAPTPEISPTAPAVSPTETAQTPSITEPAAVNTVVPPEVEPVETNAGADVETRAMNVGERPFDIIDQLEGSGKLRRLGPNEQSEYADLWRRAQKAYPALFDKVGQNPDDAATNLARPMDPEEMLSAIVTAVDARKGFAEQSKRNAREAKQEKAFKEVVVAGKRRDTSKKKLISVDELSEGDRFKVQGQDFEVDRIAYRDPDKTEIKSVRLVDGPKFGTQFVGPGTTLNIDKRSFKRRIPYTEEDAMSFGAFPQPGNRPNEGEVQAAWNAFLESPAAKGLNIELETNAALADGRVGSRLGNVIKLAKDADVHTLPHEAGHVIFDLLPENDKATVEAARKAALPKGVDPRVAVGDMTTKQFIESGLDKSLYPLINPSEFLAHFFSDDWVRSHLAQQDATIGKRIATWFKEFFQRIGDALGLTNNMDALSRRILRGDYSIDPNVAISGDEQATFSKDAMAAANAEQLAYANRQDEIEGNSQSAQGRDILNLLEKHGVRESAGSVAHAFNLSRYEGIANAGERLLGGLKRGYRDVKAAVQQGWQKNQHAREAAAQWLRFEDTLKRARNNGAAAQAELSSDRMKERIAKLDAAFGEKMLRESNLEIEKNVLRTATKKAERIMKEEAKTDLEIAEVQGELNGLKAAAESSKAMEQLMNDMAKTLLNNADGVNAWEQGAAPRKILGLYKKLKRAADEPVTNDNLLRWASYLVSASPDLRNQLHAMQLARDSQVRKELNAFQIKLLADLRQNPAATIQRILQGREKSVTQASKAEFVWQKMNQRLTRELNALNRKAEGGTIASNIEADPEYQGLRSEILKDFGYMGPEKPEPFMGQENGGSVFTSPAGTTIDLSNETMVGSKKAFAAKAQEIEKFLQETEDWLRENPESPDWKYFQRVRDVVQDYYEGAGVVTPNDKIGAPLFRWSMSVLQKTVDRAGGRLASGARRALGLWDRMFHQARRINDQATHELADLQAKAMRSHGIKWGGFRNQSLAGAAQQYSQTVLNELNGSWQHQGGGFDVGDELASGEKITKADMDYVESQAKWAFNAIRAASREDQQTTNDLMAARAGAKTYREAMQTVRYMMPRLFNYELGNFIDKKVIDDYKNGNWDGVERALNKVWGLVGPSLVRDRSADFAHATILDEAGIFQQIAQEMVEDPDRFRTIEDVAIRASEIAGEKRGKTGGVAMVENDLGEDDDGMTPEDAKDILLKEFGRIMANWKTAEQNSIAKPEAARMTGGDPKNAFTQSRDMTIAPYAFYHVGFHNSDDVSRFVAGMHSVARDRVNDALQAMLSDIERQERDFKQRVMELQQHGVKDAEGKALSQQAIERNAGETFDNWNDLQGRRRDLESAIDRMSRKRIDDQFDVLFHRFSGALVGGLVANSLTTLRNVSLIFLTRTLRNMGQGWAQGTLKSAYHTLDSAARVAAATGVEMPAIAWRMFSYLGDALRNHPEAGIGRKVYAHVIREIIRGFSEKIPGRLSNIQEMIDQGAYHLPDKVKEWDNQIFGSLWSKGRIPETDLTTGQKIALAPIIALFESGVMPVLSSAFPFLGDMTANQAVWMAAHSKFGPQGIGPDLQKVFKRITKGARPYDFGDSKNPINRLIGKELGISTDELAQRRRFFEQAGVDFDRKAAEYLQKLQAGEKNPALFTDAELARIGSSMIDLSNRSAPSHSALALQENTKLAKIASPLMGFPTRMASIWSQMMSIPVQSGYDAKNEKELTAARVRQAAYMMTFVLLASLMAGGASKIPEEVAARIWKKLAFNQETSARFPWEEEGKDRKLWSFARMGMESVPFLSVIGNGIIPNNMPARASYTPSLVALNVAQGLMDYINGWRSSGDPTYRLNDLIARTIPDSKVILNRMDRFEGSRERDNMVALAKRTGPTELVRPPYQGGGNPNITELTPYGRLLENYALSGDKDKFIQTYQDAILKAQEMGKENPEKIVSQLFLGRNPMTAAFTTKLTPEQHQSMLEKMTPAERDRFEAGERAMAEAADWVGIKEPTFARVTEKREPGAVSTAAGGGGGSPFGSTAPRRASVSAGIGSLGGTTRRAAARISLRSPARSRRVRITRRPRIALRRTRRLR